MYRASDGLLKSQLDSPIDDPVESLKRKLSLNDLGLRYRSKVRTLGKGVLASAALPKTNVRYQYNIGSPPSASGGSLLDREYYSNARSTNTQIRGNLVTPETSYATGCEQFEDCVNPRWWQSQKLGKLIRLETKRYNEFRNRYLPSHYKQWCARQDARYKDWSKRRLRLIHQYEAEYAAYRDLKPVKAARALKRLKVVQGWKFRTWLYTEPKYRPKYVDLERGLASSPCGVPIGVPKTWFLPCCHTKYYSHFAVHDTTLQYDRIALRNVGEETYETRRSKFRHVLGVNATFVHGLQRVRIPNWSGSGSQIPQENTRIDTLSLTRNQLDTFVASRLPQTMEKMSLFEIVEDARESFTALRNFIGNFEKVATLFIQRHSKHPLSRYSLDQLRGWHPEAQMVAYAFEEGRSLASVAREQHVPFPKAKGGAAWFLRAVQRAVWRKQNAFDIARSSLALPVDSYQFYRFAVKAGAQDGITLGCMLFTQELGDYGRYLKRIMNGLGRTKSYHVKLRETDSVQIIPLDPGKGHGTFDKYRVWNGDAWETSTISRSSAALEEEPLKSWFQRVTPVFRLRNHRVERATVIADASMVNLLGLDVNPYSFFTQAYLMLHYLGLSPSGYWQSIRFTYIIDKLVPWIRNFLENPRYSFIQMEYRVHQYGESCDEKVFLSYADHGTHIHEEETHLDDLGFHVTTTLDAASTTVSDSIQNREVLVASRFRRSALTPSATVWPATGRECTPQWGSWLKETAVVLAQRLLN